MSIDRSSLVRIYSDQYRWRRWAEVYPLLGDLAGARVVDLGCGIGDQARDLARLGAEVLGVDASPEVVEHARSRGIPRARFQCGNLLELQRHASGFDGAWSSFSAAYFPQFADFLRAIEPVLEPGGWLALTELDDLFGHEPLDPRWTAIVEEYYARSQEEGLYQFRSREHVRETLCGSGWKVGVERELGDDEFRFSGPASAEVLEAWRERLGFMMPRFVERFRERAHGFDTAFLDCLASKQHRSRSLVWFVLARSPVGEVADRKRGRQVHVRAEVLFNQEVER